MEDEPHATQPGFVAVGAGVRAPYGGLTAPFRVTHLDIEDDELGQVGA